jgi:hypothetical protein
MPLSHHSDSPDDISSQSGGAEDDLTDVGGRETPERASRSLARVPSALASWAVALAASGLAANLAYELGRRAVFPWDFLLWAESAFMTDMLKLAQGLSPFGPPEDANSFIYSPGLTYLCYALFAPFGVALDVRWPRSLNMLFGAVAALLLARAVVRWVNGLDGERRRPLLFAAACSLGVLLIFRSRTTTSVQPDNLQMLHAMLTFSLCVESLRRKSFRLGLLAMFVSGLAVWIKQPAGLAFVGAGLALGWGHAWGRRRTLALFGLGAGVCALSLACLLVPDQSRFYLLSIPLQHEIQWGKVIGFLPIDIVSNPHRILLWLFGPAAAWQLWQRRDEAEARAYLIPWLCIGSFEIGGSMAPYLKAFGIDNNLYPFDLWWLLASLAAFARLDAHPSRPRPPLQVLLPAGLTLALVPVFTWVQLPQLTLAPNQFAIRDVHYEYGRQFDALVAGDLEAGKRVLVAHGTMTWIRNGRRDPPLDRIVSVVELRAAGEDRVGTAQRLASRAYDRIYLPDVPVWFDATLYGPEIVEVLRANYHKVDTLPMPPPLPGLYPNDALMVPVAILEPGPETAAPPD